ncbi:30S ribosomal protein S6 [Candidatus Uhrbacteria bacterium]|nr:30S ribosomal protein S6 [Candidatus Uhrbacteria bacterium]
MTVRPFSITFWPLHNHDNSPNSSATIRPYRWISVRRCDSTGSILSGGRTTGMKEYELMYIVPTSYTEEELGTIEKHVVEVLEKYQATLKKTTRLGKLRFAYPIKHERFGHYVLLRFEAEPSAINSIDDGLRLNQKEILRHLIVDGDDAEVEKFNLVQFQEIHVETTGRRSGKSRERSPEKEKSEDKEKQQQEQKEGVAALEEGSTEEESKNKKQEDSKGDSKKGIETMSAEDLEKKIDAALEENA